MTKKIFKYELGTCERKSLSLPENPKFLSVAIQDGHIVLWAEVDTSMPVCDFEFAVCCTGESPPESYSSFLGTVQHSLVFHIFAI